MSPLPPFQVRCSSDPRPLPNAPPEAFRAVKVRTGELVFYPKRLLWGALGKVDLSDTSWAKFDEVWA